MTDSLPNSIELSLGDWRALKRAARLWIAAQLLLWLGTAGYMLALPRRDQMGIWYLIYSAGPTFDVLAARSLLLGVLCSAGFVWACWLTGGVAPHIQLPVAALARWGGAVLLLADMIMYKSMMISLAWAPPNWVYQVQAVGLIAVVLAITLHLRHIFRHFPDRALAVLLDVLLWTVVFRAATVIGAWFIREPANDFIVIVNATAPNLAALAFLLVMGRLLLIRPSMEMSTQEPETTIAASDS